MKQVFNTLIATAMLWMLCAFTASAQMSVLRLKDGTWMRGYISVQRPGHDITFHSFEAEVFVNEGDIKDIETRNVPFNSLASAWKSQALERKLLVRDGNEWALPLSTVFTLEGIHRMAQVVERGAVVKYVQHDEDDYTLSWKDILTITKETQDDDAQALLDEISMEGGKTYTGTIIEQNPGVKTKIRTVAGSVIVLEQSQIRASRKVAAAEDVNIWQARPYTNTVLLKDGTSRTGLIVVQNTGASAEDNYVEILNSNGMQERVAFADIAEYHCLPEGCWQPLKKGRLYLERTQMQQASFNTQRGYIYTTDTLATTLPARAKVSIHAHPSAELKNWSLVRLKRVALEPGNIVRGFRQAEPVKVRDEGREEDRRQQRQTIHLGALPAGCYALLDPENTQMYVIRITENTYNINY